MPTRRVLTRSTRRAALQVESTRRVGCPRAQWGHGFRESYLQLGGLRRRLAPSTPIQALTATATAPLRRDIVSQLGLRDPVVVSGSVDRPNIWWSAVDGEEAGDEEAELRALCDWVSAQPGSGLIYATKRLEAERIGDVLADAGVDAAAYHAGKDLAVRTRLQDDFMEGGLRVVVATVAFGMGINKADVRWVVRRAQPPALAAPAALRSPPWRHVQSGDVRLDPPRQVHWDPPRSLENLLQEAGRAGRDGQPAISRVYLTKRRRVRFESASRGDDTGDDGLVPVASSVIRYCASKGTLLPRPVARRTCPPHQRPMSDRKWLQGLKPLP